MSPILTDRNVPFGAGTGYFFPGPLGAGRGCGGGRRGKTDRPLHRPAAGRADAHPHRPGALLLGHLHPRRRIEAGDGRRHGLPRPAVFNPRNAEFIGVAADHQARAGERAGGGVPLLILYVYHACPG